MNLDELEAAARAATPGPWILATSNSWRRFVTKFDTRNVCEPVTYSDRDRHPDLHFPNGGADGPDAAWIALANPATILSLIARMRKLEEVAEAANRSLARIENAHNRASAAGIGSANLPPEHAALREAIEELDKP